jgi:DNA-binding NtrC family response regulator
MLIATSLQNPNPRRCRSGRSTCQIRTQSHSWSCTYLEVDTRDGFVRALEDFHPELIISGYRLSTFDGLFALSLAKNCVPDVPFIILTSSMNEGTAMECMKAGSWGYAIKAHVQRLGPVAKSALESRQVRTERAASRNFPQ